jgi:hypothetical protein
MTRWRTFVLSKLPRCGVSLLALGLVALTWTVSGEQVKQPSERDALRIRRSAPADFRSATALPGNVRPGVFSRTNGPTPDRAA